MNLVLWASTGALIGLLANWRETSLALRHLLTDAVFGGVGALCGGMLALPAERWFAAETSWSGLLAAAVGAMLMLALAHLRARRDRWQG
ncbi:hypothetical protein [Roseateles violae]|uniref:GlsB/YeaQ/YmgE family stress response membrane protein n=1 Tax=Roseateles violae TaxID=3058042 RepID=A0ABT8DT98_9BURK|nr:hypothetical protein [Pelomonas sp. PFR6]MDN3921534.1 hypothetical protein [Pelomonas sp. PFR6]